ncbi:MAG: hypothetical protein WAQ41_09720 [bacterium]|jgi:tRNA(Ile2) C34 agmatinyltransferase TiaS|nr:hypothetical protein [Bacillota bacterium]
MPFFTCPYCGKRSYSAAAHRKWVCPYCHTLVREKEERRPG